jgi:hypothetical protein
MGLPDRKVLMATAGALVWVFIFPMILLSYTAQVRPAINSVIIFHHAIIHKRHHSLSFMVRKRKNAMSVPIVYAFMFAH